MGRRGRIGQSQGVLGPNRIQNYVVWLSRDVQDVGPWGWSQGIGWRADSAKPRCSAGWAPGALPYGRAMVHRQWTID